MCRVDEREAVQKKTFTKWVNSHLGRVTCRISDLYTDLRDGRMLIRLLEVLSSEQLVSTFRLVHSPSLTPPQPPLAVFFSQIRGLSCKDCYSFWPFYLFVDSLIRLILLLGHQFVQLLNSARY